MWVTGNARAKGAHAPVALHVHEIRGAVATRADPLLYRIPLHRAAARLCLHGTRSLLSPRDRPPFCDPAG
jgi:hypothetical protein